MRIVLFGGLALALIGACGTSTESGSKCTIEGTYTMTATPETASSGCSVVPQNQASTVTVSKLDDGKFGLEFQGGTGGCTGELVEECKLQSKCDLVVTDAIDPSQAAGTLQFSWAFDASGFSGINSGAIPKAKSIPDGCTFTSNAVGKRR